MISLPVFAVNSNVTLAQSLIPVGTPRIARDRSAEEKNRQAKEKEVEYWRSIVPSPCPLGLEELHADEVVDEIQRR